MSVCTRDRQLKLSVGLFQPIWQQVVIAEMMWRFIEARSSSVCVQVNQIGNVFGLSDGDVKCENIVRMIGTAELLLWNETEVFTIQSCNFSDCIG